MGDLSSHSKSNLALIRVLVKIGLIDSNQALGDASKAEVGPIAHFARQGCYDEQEAVQLVAQHLKIPVTVINRATLPAVLTTLENPRVSAVSIDRWRAMRALPVELGDSWLVLAMANPFEQEYKTALEFELGLQVRISITLEEQLLTAIGHKLNSGKLFDLNSILADTNSEAEIKTVPEVQLDSNLSGSDAAAAPVIRLVNKILSDSVSAGASDIHLAPEKSGLAVRIRVDGIINQMQEVPLHMRGAVVSRLKLLAGMDISERRKPQDGRLRIDTAMGPKDLRVSTVPTVHGENVVIRILSTDFGRLSLESLGLPEPVLKGLLRSLKSSSRVVLVSGPTGSGKTSSLYAALLHLADGKSNIITVEDPIEYRIDGISQIQVNTKADVTFAEGLRSILRQDPDIIMVGEIRDQETASIAMNAAQTGHLVLSTLHTNTAAAAITRLRDLGIPSYLIASSLGSVLAQRLVRKLCSQCAVAHEGLAAAAYAGTGLDLSKLKKAVGCKECRGTGYQGRTGIFSLLEITDGLREAIRHEQGEAEMEALAKEIGFMNLACSGIELLNRGSTSLEELERVLGPLDTQVDSVRGTPAAARFQKEALMPQAVVASRPKAGAPLARRRLLLVEDDQDTRAVLTMVLRGELFEVVEACDGLEALEKVYEQLPEIILCDLMMPRMSGLEFTEKLRRDPRTREIPIVILTAADTEDTEIELMDGGADDFVSKASGTKLLLARINRILERRPI